MPRRTQTSSGTGGTRTRSLEFRKLLLYPFKLPPRNLSLLHKNPKLLYPRLYPNLYPTQALLGTNTPTYAYCPPAKSLILHGGSR